MGRHRPQLESTVAALAFNRLAQETFEKHTCADRTHQDRTQSFSCCSNFGTKMQKPNKVR